MVKLSSRGRVRDMAALTATETTASVIHARWVVPINENDDILEHHSVVILNGVMVTVLPTCDAKDKQHLRQYIKDYDDDVVEVDLSENHVVIPGLINMHCHMAMSLLRGIGGDVPLMTWLTEQIWPIENVFVSKENFVADGTRLAAAESIRSGVTCIDEMYFLPMEAARVLDEVGLRALIGAPIMMFPTPQASTSEEYFAKAKEFLEAYKDKDLIVPSFAAHAPYTVTDEQMVQIKNMANEYTPPIRINMHVHETQKEVDDALASGDGSGVRPLRRLHSLNLLDSNFIAVHAVVADDTDLALLRDTSTNVVHCPESNAILGSGVCQVQTMINAGINVCIGTDGAASNNDLSLLGDMRTAGFIAKLFGNNAAHLPVMTLLRMATINGAKALGLEHRIGSLERGKDADITAISLGTVNTMPVFNPVSQLIYAAGKDNVTDVWVAGRRLLENRKLTTINESEILERAAQWSKEILAEQRKK